MMITKEYNGKGMDRHIYNFLPRAIGWFLIFVFIDFYRYNTSAIHFTWIKFVGFIFCFLVVIDAFIEMYRPNRYLVSDDGITGKRLLGKDKKFKFLDILKIEYKAFVIPFIGGYPGLRIYLKDDTKIVIRDNLENFEKFKQEFINRNFEIGS